jgi:ribulose 1,5-bisphosphate synthetase/thiazole synthase
MFALLGEEISVLKELTIMNNVKLNRNVDVIAEYDTVVCGGGPAGWIAAVSSARSGKKTALIERYGFIGGTATAGYVVPISGFFFKEKRVVGGIAWEFVQKL